MPQVHAVYDATGGEFHRFEKETGEGEHGIKISRLCVHTVLSRATTYLS